MKIIDDIVWYIPFKKLRNAIRTYLYKLIEYNDEFLSLKKERINFYKVVEDKIVIESAEYFLQYASNAKLLHDKKDLYLYIFEKYIINSNYKDKLFLEFGVWKGDSINLFSNILTDVIFYGFDSFEGLPESSGFWTKGRFDLNGNLPIVNKNVHLIKGWFDETLPIFLKDHKEKVAFIHVDCDLYSSTKIIFDNIYDRITEGTIIEFDEYYCYRGWKNHEYKAFQEFCKKYNVKYEYIATFIMNYSQAAGKMAVRIISIDN